MTGIKYLEIKPTGSLTDFVESFWMLYNNSDQEREVIIVPDGRIDLAFSTAHPFNLTLVGIESHASRGKIQPHGKMYSVSFKLLAVEHLFQQQFPSLLNTRQPFPADYLGVTAKDFSTLDQFAHLLSQSLLSKLKLPVDIRKEKLFDLIYSSNGAMPIHELADKAGWSSRQINRYFNQWFGMPLKAYCNILRFRASFPQIKQGNLYPDLDFADQAHFIRDVKKFSGVTPGELNKNENDRFIQLSVMPPK